MVTQLDNKQTIASQSYGNAKAYPPAIVVSLVLFAAINFLAWPFYAHASHKLTKEEVLSSRYEKMHQGPWSWWLSRAYLAAPPANIIVMGDSQINAVMFQADVVTRNRAVDCLIDREAVTLEQLIKERTGKPSRAVNLAIAGAMASDQYLLGKALLSKNTPKVVIIGISPRTFLDNTLPSPSTTEPFRFFERYVDIGPLAHDSFPDAWTEAAWRFKSYLPLLELHDQVCDYLVSLLKLESPLQNKQIQEEKLADPSKVLAAIYGNEGDVRPGQSVIKGAVFSGYLDNEREYMHRYQNPNVDSYRAQKEFFQSYLSALNSLGVKVLVVGMPSLEVNRRLLDDNFWSNYRSWVVQECGKTGAIWFDLSQDPAFKKNYFLDNVHLNCFGSKLLLNKIAAVLIMCPQIKDRLNTTDTASQATNLRLGTNSQFN